MNDARRRRIESIMASLRHIREEVEVLQAEEEEYASNIPEPMDAKRDLANEKAENLQEAADDLSEAIDSLENVL